MPPAYDYGIYDLPTKLVFSPKELDAFPLDGDLGHLSPLLSKLAAGGRGKVLAIGGSMTFGGRCVQRDLDYAKCAWPVRVGQWLRAAFPNATVELHNLARGATGSDTFLTHLPEYTKGHYDADLVFLDTSVNDGINEADSKSTDALLGIYELLILAVRRLMPRAGIFGILGACHLCNRSSPEHGKALRYHRVPAFDLMLLRDLLGERLWPIAGVDDKHPLVETHQAIADLLGAFFSRAWQRTCPGAALPPPLRDPPLVSNNPERTCFKPLSTFVAGDDTTSQPTVERGDWRMYADRPGKPGWIAQQRGARLQFRVLFGAHPRLAVTYLRSYQNISDAKITHSLSGRSFSLRGKWETPRNVSVAHTVWFDALYGLPSGEESPEHSFMAFARPYKLDTFDIELVTDGKVKIIAVVSC